MNAQIQIAEWVERLGWVLVHFVWEGALLGLITWFGLCLLRKTSAQSRYLFLCTAMIACLLLPCITWTLLNQKQSSPSVGGAVSVSVQNSTDHSFARTIQTTLAAVVHSHQSDPVPSLSFPKQFRKLLQTLLPYLVTIWSVGVLLLSIRILFGWLQLQHFCGSGVPVQDKRWGLRLNELSDLMGIKGTVQLLESLFIEVPTVIGWLRPAILVPVSFLSGLPTDQVESILAHELAHIRRHDYLANLFQLAIETLLFYHPVVWWISNSIREERENCCDDIALGVIGDKATYVTALAALEESRSLPMAITMSATGGSLLQRIRRIVGVEGGRKSSWLFLLTILVVAAIAGSVIWKTKQQQKAEKKPYITKPAHTLKITCIDQLGTTVAGASVKAEWPDHSTNLTTDTQGVAHVALPAARLPYLSARVYKEGFVPKIIEWTLDQPSFNLPSEFTLKMEKAQSIGGFVKNEKGEPIENAKVVLIIRGSSMGGVAQEVFNDLWERRVTTDKNGKWHFDEAPSDLHSLSVTLEHPDYISNECIDPRPGDDEFKQQKALLIAHKGMQVDGTVTDDKGQPISGVDVTFGEAGSGTTSFPSTTTDAQGHFHFNGISTKKSYLAPILTFTSVNHAPVMITLDRTANAQPIKVTMNSGKRLQIRFVDKQGQPVKGVTLCADTWQGHRPFGCLRFKSDTNGLAVWEHAPEGPITYELGKDSFLNESPTLQPSDEVQTYQLKRPTVISGRVLDAVTQKPITDYQLIPGMYFPEPHSNWTEWIRLGVRQFRTDSYRYIFYRPAEMMSSPPTEGFHRIRIEAPGYEPGVSRPIANNEESVSLDFSLKPQVAIHGLVTAADGSPVKNTQIVVAGYGNASRIHDGVFSDQSSQLVVTTGENGKYELPAQEEDYPIAIVQPDKGYFTTTYKELKAAPNVRLLAWGEIDLTNENSSDKDHSYYVEYWNKEGPPYHAKQIYFQNDQPNTKPGDRMILKHLVAGPVSLLRMMSSNKGLLALVENGKTTKVDLKTGKTGIVEPDGTIRDPGNVSELVLAKYFPNLAVDNKQESQTKKFDVKSPDVNPTNSLSIQVNDQAGKPIQGASVKPTGLRTKEEHASWYGIRPQEEHLFSSGTTDAEGKASISFPSHTVDKLTTGTVIVLVQHPEACSSKAELNIDAPKPVKLARGTKVMLSAQPLPGISFSRIEADIVDDKRQAELQKWTHAPDGLSVSAHLPDGNDLVRLVGMTPQGKIYFSDSVPISLLAKPESGKTPQSGDFDLKKSFMMHEGGMVKGVLDSSVPRPVKGGWIASCVSSPHLGSDDGNFLINTWFTSADVAEDGSFLLTNLPAGSLEIVAGCDGYVSKDEADHFFSGIHKAQLIGNDRSQQLSIPMEKTGEVRVEVQTPDGKPLSGATVGFSPNQGMGNCNGLLGARFNSAEMLSHQETDAAMPAKQQAASLPFHAKTDASGVALVKGLPVGEQDFSVRSDSYDMPYELIGPQTMPRQQRTVVVPGSVTVTMKNKASSTR